MGTNKLGGGIAEQGSSGMGRWVWEGDRFGVNPNLLNGPDPSYVGPVGPSYVLPGWVI